MYLPQTLASPNWATADSNDAGERQYNNIAPVADFKVWLWADCQSSLHESNVRKLFVYIWLLEL